jgi:hypothetical protein
MPRETPVDSESSGAPSAKRNLDGYLTYSVVDNPHEARDILEKKKQISSFLEILTFRRRMEEREA